MNALKTILGTILYMLGILLVIGGTFAAIAIPIGCFLSGLVPTVSLALLYFSAPLLIPSFIFLFTTNKWYAALPGLVASLYMLFSGFFYLPVFIGYVLIFLKKLIFQKQKTSNDVVNDPFIL